MKPLIILQILEKNKKSGIGAEDDVMYLGNSENDNLTFRKAGISMGIYSDARLDPKLDCSYLWIRSNCLLLRGLGTTSIC